MEERSLARSTSEAVLPELSTKATIAQSATTVDDALFEAPIALKALLRNVPSWAQVVVKGKKRSVEEEVGRAPDPMVRWGNVAQVMVKVGGVRWDDGIGGVVEGLKQSGFVVCGKEKWLVGVEERKRRMEQGSRSSTVLVKVMDKERAGELCWAGLWVGSVWCSVRKFVAVPVRCKESGWVRVVDRVDERMGTVEYGLAQVNEE